MTLRTITFDDSIYKLVPLEPTEETLRPLSFLIDEDLATIKKAYCDVIAAAPEYQDIAQSVVEENGKLRQRLADKSAWIKLLKSKQDTKKDE